MEANFERLAHWFPDAFQEPPTLEGVRADLARAGQAWLEGSLLPVSNAVKATDGWRLVGWAQLVIDGPARSAEVGYWRDPSHTPKAGIRVTRLVKPCAEGSPTDYPSTGVEA